MITRLRALLMAAVFGAALFGGALPVVAAPAGAQDLFTIEDRAGLDLERFVVTDPTASYFDVDARREWLTTTRAPALLRTIETLRIEVGCQDKLALPIVVGELRMPAFYEDNVAWREAIRPLFAFEDAVSDLAGAFAVTGDRYHADCLLDLLGQWAAADALLKFHYTPQERQAWFNVEDMLFAAGLAYSVVRDRVDGRAADKARIDAWLARAARNHFAIAGGSSSCCNNHFYRRSLYATVIGILTADDEMFRIGLTALYSVLHELGPEGELPREIVRGGRAVHYQNYALVYLVPIAELVSRQGYDAYGLSVNGRTLHDAVAFTLDILEDPANLGDRAPAIQDRRFVQDGQYFAWMELYLSRFANPRMERWLTTRRPLYNRSAGGYTSLFFWDPDRTPPPAPPPS